jgi:hypothetical protein
MKKIILSILIMSVFTISCESSDDDITYKTPDYLSGKWIFKEIGTINAQNVLVYQDYVNEAACEADNLQLNPDKTFSFNDYTTEGIACVNQNFSGSYSIVNKELILNYTIENIEYEDIFTIVSLTYDEVTVSGSNDLGEIVFYKLSK